MPSTPAAPLEAATPQAVAPVAQATPGMMMETAAPTPTTPAPAEPVMGPELNAAYGAVSPSADKK